MEKTEKPKIENAMEESLFLSLGFPYLSFI